MKKIQYREAYERDLDDLADLWWIMQKSHDAYDALLYANLGQKQCKNLTKIYFTELLKAKTCMIHCATTSDKIVGFIIAHLQTRPPVYEIKRQIEIEVTIVHPNYRQTGIFQNLLKCIEERAKHAGISMISLTVDHENPAKYAYEATGFSTRQHKMIKWI